MDYPIDENLHLPTCVNVVDSRVWTQMKRATQMLGTLPGTGLHLEKAANELAAEGEGWLPVFFCSVCIADVRFHFDFWVSLDR
jgi:hypothetical protein